MHRSPLIDCCRCCLLAIVYAVIFAALLGSSAPGTQPTVSAGRPDLLRLESLVKKLQPIVSSTEELTASIPSDGFLLPTGDELDQLMEVDSQVRVEALGWVEKYANRQALFAPADLQELKQRLQTLPPAAVNRWLDQSRDLRERLASEEWMSTDRWLGQFLAAQSVYTPADLAKFQHRLARLPSYQLPLVLDHFQLVREERQRQRSSMAQHRQLSLESARRMQWTPRTAQAGALAGRPTSQERLVVPARQAPVFYRSRSLSQRAADIYIYRAIYGRNFLWWGMW